MNQSTVSVVTQIYFKSANIGVQTGSLKSMLGIGEGVDLRMGLDSAFSCLQSAVVRTAETVLLLSK